MNKKTLTREWEKSCGKAENNPNSVWDKLEQAENELLIRRPPGSFTAMEYANKRGLTRNAAQNALETLARSGRIRKHKGTRLVYWSLIE